MRIFSHRHENLFSWAREFRLFVAPRGRPTVRSGRGTSSASAPSIILPIAQNTFPFSLYIEQIPEASRRWGSPSVDEGGRRPRTSAIGHDNVHRIFKAPVFLLLIIRPLERSARASPVARPGKGLSGMAAVVCRRRGNRPTLSKARSPTRPDIGYRQEKERRLDRFDANQRRRQAKSQVGRPSWRPRRHTPELEPFGTRTSYAKLKSQKSARLVRRFTPPSRSLLPP